MAKNDQALVSVQDIPLALTLLSRLPVRGSDNTRAARAAWAYPLVGLILGLIAGLAGLLAASLGLPEPLTALISLAILTILTGAMHEDGLADTADGLWGGWDPARRLEIMKDSRIGAYGVVALTLSLLSRWAALWVLFEAGTGIAIAALVASAALSRATMPALMSALPHARPTGLSHSVGQVPNNTSLLAAAVAVLIAILTLGWGFLMAVFWAAVIAIAMAAIARAKIGGQTGDILGGTQQLAEIAVLFSIAA